MAASKLTNGLTTGPRHTAATVLLWLAFLNGCLFLGIGENLLFLFFSAGALLAALAVSGPGALLRAFAPGRYDGWLCVAALAALVLSFFFVTFAPEGSFAVSWILAAVPLAYLACVALGDRRLLRGLIVATVVFFALVSVLRFLLDGQRAYEPLIDPNNYASLLYLIWIPVAHQQLLRAWDGGLAPRQLAAAALLLVLALALFATESRTGMAVLAAALLGWLVLALLQRRSLTPWVALLALTSLAYGLALLAAPGGVGSTFDRGAAADGLSLRGALNGAAWDMFLTAPLTGSGLSTFPLLYPLYRRLGDQGTAGMFVHNDYLQLLAESGPWLVLLLALVAAATARKLLLGLLRAEHTRDFGLAMAVAALLAHAAVNFVFYILPLCLLFAGLLAELFGRAAPPLPEARAAAAAAAPRALWLGALVASIVAWAYLALDVATQGVFGEQPAPSALTALRQQPREALRFAQQAQRLNGNRVTPVLAEAFLSAALLPREAPSEARLATVRAQFRHALALDPLNPLVYERYYEFLRGVRDPGFLATLKPEESPERLLRRAVELDVLRVDTLFELLAVLDRLGRSDEALRLLEDAVYPWIERIHRDNPANAGRVLQELGRRVPPAERGLFEARESEVASIGPRQKGHWLREFMGVWGRTGSWPELRQR